MAVMDNVLECWNSPLYFSCFICHQTEEKEEEEEALVGEVKASPNADTTILFVKGEGKA